jgi:hypothetical protein
MHWTHKNPKDSENLQKILRLGSIFSAATVLYCLRRTGLAQPLKHPRMSRANGLATYLLFVCDV